MTKGRVLIVDDSALILGAARVALEGAGFHVVTLDNPLKLNIVVQVEHPDVVIMDVNMPAATGDVVVRVVNQRGLMKEVPVILFSDIPSAELRERARLCGARGYLQKSAGPEGLVQYVSDLLAREA